MLDGRRHVGDPAPPVLGGMWHAHNHTSPNEVLEKRMAILSNSRHEKFSQLVASGTQPAAAYRSLGYSSKGGLRRLLADCAAPFELYPRDL